MLHIAFYHDLSKYRKNIDTAAVIAALTDALASSGKPLITTFRLGLLAPGKTPTEEDAANAALNPRSAAEPPDLVKRSALKHRLAFARP